MSGLLASLFRNNFVYAVGVMFLLDLLAALTRHNKRYGILSMGCLLGAVLTVVITGPGYQMMGVGTSPKKESLSVPIVQMSAVYVNFQDFGTNFSRHQAVWTNSLSAKVPIK